MEGAGAKPDWGGRCDLPIAKPPCPGCIGACCCPAAPVINIVPTHLPCRRSWVRRSAAEGEAAPPEERGSIYAVGRYQLIPSTMKLALQWSKISWSEKFTPEVQDRLFCTLLSHKRPQVGRYLLGEGSLQHALDSLAKEWASVAYRGPYSYYSGIGGNRAHITVDEAAVALEAGRAL